MLGVPNITKPKIERQEFPVADGEGENNDLVAYSSCSPTAATQATLLCPAGCLLSSRQYLHST